MKHLFAMRIMYFTLAKKTNLRNHIHVTQILLDGEVHILEKSEIIKK